MIRPRRSTWICLSPLEKVGPFIDDCVPAGIDRHRTALHVDTRSRPTSGFCNMSPFRWALCVTPPTEDYLLP